MALDFDSASSDKINVGSGTSLDNLTTGTYLSWVFLRSSPAHDGAISWKGLAASGSRQFRFNSGGSLLLAIFRATTNTQIEGTPSAIGFDKWSFVATVHNTGGANGDQKLFGGDLSTIAAEPSSYISQSVGSGAVGDNSSTDMIIGNRETNGRNFEGLIAWIGIWNRVLTLGEMQAQQFRPHVTSGCVLFTHCGYNGTGTQADWSGNGNNGTVTGATVADHVPLGPPFGFDVSNPYTVAAAVAAATNRRRKAMMQGLALMN